MAGRIRSINKLFTPASGTTTFINYFPEQHLLEVQFRDSAKVYHYKDVDPELWQEFRSLIQSGGSSGNFINTRIKPYYDFEEVS